MLLAATASALTGCGGSDSDLAAGGNSPLRARFTERTTYPGGAGQETQGAFDWEAMRGHFSEQDLYASTVEQTREVIQIESRCYERIDGKAWRESAPDEQGSTCDPQFLNPRSEVELLRFGSSEWTEIGSANLNGVETTRYTAHFQVGAIDERIEIWLDDADLPLKIIRSDSTDDPERAYKVVREYFDLEHPVDVSAPSG